MGRLYDDSLPPGTHRLLARPLAPNDGCVRDDSVPSDVPAAAENVRRAEIISSFLALNVDQLVAEGDRPTRSVGGYRPGPAFTELDIRDHVTMTVVGDDVTGSELVSVDRRHRDGEYSGNELIRESVGRLTSAVP